MELAVVGTSRFILGFALAGAHTELAQAGNLMERIDAIEDAKIVIVDGTLVEQLPHAARARLETSIEPVIISLAVDDTEQAERLRHMIKNTLGVDLFK